MNAQTPAQFVIPAYDAKNPLNVRAQITRMPQGQVRLLPPNARRLMHSVTSKNQKNTSPGFLYDIYDYPAAGSPQFNFFGRTQNQAGLNATDTNLQQPGNVGAGVRFLVKQIWIDFYPGSSPVTTAVEATLVATNQIVDYTKVMAGRGWFQFFVNQTPQLGWGFSPLKFGANPVQVGADMSFSASGVSANPLQAGLPYTRNGGFNTSFMPFWLDESLNFAAQIQFPTNIAVTAGARIGVTLYGEHERPAS